MAYSESQKRAVAKYNAKAYDRIELRVPKGQKPVLQENARRAGVSLNAWINDAIDEKNARGL